MPFCTLISRPRVADAGSQKFARTGCKSRRKTQAYPCLRVRCFVFVHRLISDRTPGDLTIAAAVIRYPRCQVIVQRDYLATQSP